MFNYKLFNKMKIVSCWHSIRDRARLRILVPFPPLLWDLSHPHAEGLICGSPRFCSKLSSFYLLSFESSSLSPHSPLPGFSFC